MLLPSSHCRRFLLAMLFLLTAPEAFAAGAGPCSVDAATGLAPGDARYTVSLDPETEWQPQGGEVKFQVKGETDSLSPETMNIFACFRWRGTNTWRLGALRVIPTVGGALNTVSFGVVVPDLGDPPQGWLARLLHKDSVGGDYTTFGMVPAAEMRLLANAKTVPAPDWSPVDVTLPLGITNVRLSLFFAALLVVVTLAALMAISERRSLPGGNPLLRIIASGDGFASLSRFQLLLWSLVIGSGAVYVMVLSGNLINISNGTLILLGIAGASGVGSALQGRTPNPSATSQAAGDQGAGEQAAGTVSAPVAAPVAVPAQTPASEPRVPRWSDLVIAADSQKEIDVTRVQMLFFTIIGAIFVGLTIITTGVVPAIPENFLLLMGISNGVYLSNKFVPR